MSPLIEIITRVKTIKNVYKEFECHFNTLFEQISTETDDMCFKDIKKELDYIRDERIFEKYLEKYIDKIESHLLIQYKDYTSIKLILTRKLQEKNQKEYLPKNRNNEIKNAFVFMISLPDYKKVSLNKYQNQIFSIGFNAYENCYNTLVATLDKLFDSVLLTSPNNITVNKQDFERLFISVEEFNICKECMEEIDLIYNGKVQITKGRAGKVIGLMQAIIEFKAKLIRLEKINEKTLFQYLNTYLDTNFKSINKRSDDYEEAFDLAKKFFHTKLKK